MNDEFGYGPRLSGEEYDRKVVALYKRLPPMPTREQDQMIRRAELDLKIDHRLGRDFPQGKRDELWRIMQNIERRRLWMAGKYVLMRLFSRRSRHLVEASQGLAWSMAQQFSHLLSDRELESFLGLDGSAPTLPIDFEHENR